MIGRFQACGDGYLAVLEEADNLLLQRLVREILVVLDEPGDLTSFMQAVTGFESVRAAPHDPALTSLLPPMSRDSPVADELRALTEDFLRSEKSTRLRAVAAALRTVQGHSPGQIFIRSEDVWEWLAAFNDIRLALAGELGIHSERDAQRVTEMAVKGESSGASAPMERHGRGVSAMYLAVTWWQESLLRAVRQDAAAH